MRAVACLIFVVSLLLRPATAVAQYPGERPSDSHLIAHLVPLGESYWTARGVQPCPQPTLLMADDLQDEDGRFVAALTHVGGCRILFDADIADDATTDPLSRYSGASLCLIVVHELGHTAGLLDWAGGPMSTEIPRECYVWADARARKAARDRCRHARRPTACFRRRLNQS
jgi:hypothetical protein